MVSHHQAKVGAGLQLPSPPGSWCSPSGLWETGLPHSLCKHPRASSVTLPCQLLGPEMGAPGQCLVLGKPHRLSFLTSLQHEPPQGGASSPNPRTSGVLADALRGPTKAPGSEREEILPRADSGMVGRGQVRGRSDSFVVTLCLGGPTCCCSVNPRDTLGGLGDEAKQPQSSGPTTWGFFSKIRHRAPSLGLRGARRKQGDKHSDP